MPGLGEKAEADDAGADDDEADGYIFSGVGAGGGGDKGGGVALAAPNKPSKGELMEAEGGDKLPGALVSGLLGSASPARLPA